jgi:MFS family permease
MLSSAPTLALIFTVMGPVLPMVSAHFGAAGPPIVIPALGIAIDSTLFAQLVGNLPSFGLMLGGAPTGLAIDRFGARNVLIAGFLGFALFGSAGLYVESAEVLLGSRLALGFAAVACAGATIWLIGARFDDRSRARVLSARNILGGVGGVASTFAAGHIASQHGWHGAFALYLAPLAIVPVALLTLRPASPGSHRAKADAPRDSLRHLAPIIASIVALSIVMMMNTTQLPFLLTENGLASPDARSHVMVVGSAATMAGSVLYALIGPELSLRWNYSLIALALGAGVAAIGLSHGALLASVGCGLTGFGAGMLAPHFIRIVLGRAPAAARGRAVGLAFSAIYFGDFVNPFVVHPLAVAIGIHQAFMLIGGGVAVTALQIFLPGGLRNASMAAPEVAITRP